MKDVGVFCCEIESRSGHSLLDSIPFVQVSIVPQIRPVSYILLVLPGSVAGVVFCREVKRL